MVCIRVVQNHAADAFIDGRTKDIVPDNPGTKASGTKARV